jgi:hypothetical protein
MCIYSVGPKWKELVSIPFTFYGICGSSMGLVKVAVFWEVTPVGGPDVICTRQRKN